MKKACSRRVLLRLGLGQTALYPLALRTVNRAKLANLYRKFKAPLSLTGAISPNRRVVKRTSVWENCALDERIGNIEIASALCNAQFAHVRTSGKSPA
jgi:hypothetical protein